MDLPPRFGYVQKKALSRWFVTRRRATLLHGVLSSSFNELFSLLVGRRHLDLIATCERGAYMRRGLPLYVVQCVVLIFTEYRHVHKRIRGGYHIVNKLLHHRVVADRFVRWPGIKATSTRLLQGLTSRAKFILRTGCTVQSG